MAAAAPPARPGAATDCFHCGLPVPPGTSFGFEADGQRRAFCCAGCEAVSRAISGGGLDDYYRLREAAAPRPARSEDCDELRLYDEPALQQRFARDAGAGEREASILVDGMRCTACAWLVEQVAARVPGVTSATAHFGSRRALVRWNPAATRLSEVLAAIRSFGYPAWPFEAGRLAALEAKERRTMLRRLWVAGLGMMQVMMYAVPSYIAGSGDIAPDIQRLLDWAGLTLTLPVLAYSGWPFFAGAWRSLANRALGMDVPVALGIAASFAASAVATVRGSGPVYFDSITMFVFLLTAGRYLEHLARARAGLGLRRLERYVPQAAQRLRDGNGLEAETVPAALLAPGDRVRVRSGDALPADGVLEGEEAWLNESLLTGESAALRRGRGEALLGGSVNAGSAFVMRVERVGSESTLATIERLMERALAERPRWVELAQRASSLFVAGVLVAALLAGLAWLTIDPARAPWIAISVLIVTCPCALSLAAPAAMTVALGEMARFGFVVSRGHAIEALAAATDVVFDKTGTLTLGRPRVLEVLPLGQVAAADALAIAAAIASGSNHPLDRALAEAGAGLRRPAIDSHCSHPGSGEEARIAGRRHRIGQASFCAALHGLASPIAWLHTADTVVWLADDAGWIAAFRIGDAVRPEAGRVVARLRELGLGVHLLTGDEARVAHRVAAELGIERVRSCASPEGKQDYVRALQREGRRVAMVGDGVNDAPVLGLADVSVAMGHGADLAQVRADAVLASGSLDDLVRAVDLARRTRAVLRQNLAWALAYNAVVLPLAFLGLVTPLAAGVGMASSSLAVVANALRLRARDRS
ncbi:MAG TPA: heavy metal translocating P-type ATPase [Usitatibacter sp.]|nr:heavy metal translocating P-type ATPase [Usitatibacter sp.]